MTKILLFTEWMACRRERTRVVRNFSGLHITTKKAALETFHACRVGHFDLIHKCSSFTGRLRRRGTAYIYAPPKKNSSTTCSTTVE